MSSDEPRQLLQWFCHDFITVNVAKVGITIITVCYWHTCCFVMDGQSQDIYSEDMYWLYETWHARSDDIRSANIAWNNSFRKVFNSFWRECVLSRYWCLVGVHQSLFLPCDCETYARYCCRDSLRPSVRCLSVKRVYCDKTKAPSEKSSIMTNRKSPTSFPMSLR